VSGFVQGRAYTVKHMEVRERIRSVGAASAAKFADKSARTEAPSYMQQVTGTEPQKKAAPHCRGRPFLFNTDSLDIETDIALTGKLEEAGRTRIFDVIDKF